MSTVIIMAGGTGGHVYPALAVGAALRQKGVNVYWMGVPGGLEDRLAKEAGFGFDPVRIKGLWGKGIVRWLTAPLWLTVSVVQSISIILRRRPDALIGMGGYVCGPGGLASWFLRRPLVIHESNTVPGMTNRVLARLSTRVLTGFPNTKLTRKSTWVGTPVRLEIIEAAQTREPVADDENCNLRLLVVGGSQGAEILNQTIPLVIGDLPDHIRPEIIHQSGRGKDAQVINDYAKHGISAQVLEYIDDMAKTYTWADIIVARAGAMTLSEISIMGLAAILVPYPHAAGDHQRVNAELLASSDCAIVCIQDDTLTFKLGNEIKRLLSDRNLVRTMSRNIQKLAKLDATSLVVDNCMNVMRI